MQQEAQAPYAPSAYDPPQPQSAPPGGSPVQPAVDGSSDVGPRSSWDPETVVRTIVVPALLAIIAGLALHRSLNSRVIVAGVGLGVAAGAAIAMLPAFTPYRRRNRSVRWAVVAAVVVVDLAIVVGAFAIAARSWRGPLTVGSVVGNFLVVRLPAAGLSGLAVIPTLVTLPAAAAAVAAARRGWAMLSIGAPLLALLAAESLVVPVGANSAVPIAFASVATAGLLLDARRRHVEIQPLVGVERSESGHVLGVRSLLAIAAAFVLAAAAIVIPLRSTLDVRDIVAAPSVDVRDPNPLATAARLRLNAGQPSDVDIDSVTVAGPSPGRLRLAVLDRYTTDGWEQDATYAITGSSLDPGPILGSAASTATSTAAPARTSVTVVPGERESQFAAVPTGGSPISVSDPNGVRYSATAGVLLGGNWQSPVSYEALVRTGERPSVVEAPSPAATPDLSQCPDSSALRQTASVLVEGVVSPLDRLARIDSWLKLQRIYDPTAPGGQTQRSVERFLEQDFARGNLEMFVTAEALLARCAGVSVRAVVGYSAPGADTTTTFRASDVQAWIETPLARSGWVVVDPVPTVAEQQRQAQVAREPKSDQIPPVTTTPPTTRRVLPKGVSSHSRTTLWISLAATALLVMLLAGWAFGLPAMTDRRRRHALAPDAAVLAAWTSVTDRFADANVVLGSHWTPRETIQHTNGIVPFDVTRMASELWPLVDLARFGGDLATEDHAGRAWALRDEIVRISPNRVGRAVKTLTHPVRTVRRFREARSIERGAVRWSGTLPAEVLATTKADAIRIEGLELVSLLGSGSTSDVYRGHRADDDHPVAVKVFKYAVTDSGYTQQRFEWEARVAKLISGLDNLPEVYDSGVTASGLPYMTMKLYEQGTLFHRVRRGGPISAGEVRIAGQQLAKALEILHQSSILHGDIKPENIFIDDDGFVLGDLGAAWLRADGGPAAGMTPPYAAPEVWRGQAPSVASDIYSLGLTLMFAATGRVPVAGVAIDIVDVTDAFGDDELAPVFEVDPRRRPRRAIDIAKLLGAEDESPVVATSATLSLPNPTFTYHPTNRQ